MTPTIKSKNKYIKTKKHRENLAKSLKGNKNSVGIKRTKEHKEAIAKANILRNTGKKQTAEHIAKRVKKMLGKNNPAWKGGITPINIKIRMSKEYKLWRKAVFERDNYTCIWCGARSGNGKAVILNADHIKPFSLFPELRFAIDNGRTLCEDCHKKTDTFGWKIYNNKNYGRNKTYDSPITEAGESVGETTGQEN